MRRNETEAERGHRYDREVIAADHRWRKAKAGRGYRFIAPEGIEPPFPSPSGAKRSGRKPRGAA